MKKIIMLLGFAMLLASPAFAQAPVGNATGSPTQSTTGYGTGNTIFPGNPSAAAAAGAWSGVFTPGEGAFAYQPPTKGVAAFAYEPEPASRQECAQRFKSFDPRSGTYLGRDGYRHSCP